MAKAGAGPAAPPPPPPVQAPPPPPPIQAPAPGQDAQRGAANALFSEINKAGTNIASGTCFLLGVHCKVVLTAAHLFQVFSMFQICMYALTCMYMYTDENNDICTEYFLHYKTNNNNGNNLDTVT